MRVWLYFHGKPPIAKRGLWLTSETMRGPWEQHRNVFLGNVVFVIDPVKQKEQRESGKKITHAFARGDLLGANDADALFRNKVGDLAPLVEYDPWRDSDFHIDGEPIDGCGVLWCFIDDDENGIALCAEPTFGTTMREQP